MRLYNRSRLGHALAWIGSYVLLCSLADGASEALGMAKCITAPLCVLLSLMLWCWLHKNGLEQRFGLCRLKGRAKDYLYFVPLALICLANLSGGIALRMSGMETFLYVLSMLGVGFLEEVIFRGLLFRAMEENGMKQAMLVSAATFGLGHIVNLLNGAPVADTLVQIVGACVLGLLFVLLYVRCGSLWPCILTHGILNSLSAFAPEQGDWLGALIIMALAALYMLWIWKHKKGVLE